MVNNENINTHFEFATKIGLDGKSAYEVATDNGFVGDANAWLIYIRKPATDAYNMIMDTDEFIRNFESNRQSSECNRDYTEAKRQKAELERISTETVRTTQEQERVVAEAARQITTKEAVDKSNKAAEEALVITSAIASGSHINPDLISPLQGLYTSISSPNNDATVQWSGNINLIGTNDFTIQFCGAFDNSLGANNCVCKLGTNGIMSNANSVLVDSEFATNQLGFVWFPYGVNQEYLDTGIAVQCAKSPYKPHCLFFGREGNEAFVYANGGERKIVPLASVMEISNLLTLSNASNTTLVRKFNFAINDEIAKSLYNGGRWSEKRVDSKYLSEPLNYKILDLSQITTVDADGASVSTISNSTDGTTLNISTVRAQQQPTIHLDITDSNSDNLVVNVEIDINIPNNGTAVAPHIYSGANKIEPVGYTQDQKVGSGSYKFTYDSLNTSTSQHLMMDIDGRTLATYTIKKVAVYTHNLDHEYLPSSITKTKWRDTHGNVDLNPTKVDKIVFNTEPILQEKLWGEGTPTLVPDAIGQEYIDTLNKITYKAYSTTDVSGWSIL